MKVILDEVTSFNVSYDVIDRPSDFEVDLSDLEIEMNKNQNTLETSIFSKIRVKSNNGSVEFEANETTEDLVVGALFNHMLFTLKT